MSLPSGYKRLEYIQSSGTQYIDTGFVCNGNSKIEAEFEVLDASNNGAYLYGGGSGSARIEAYPWAGTMEMNYGSLAPFVGSLVANKKFYICQDKGNFHFSYPDGSGSWTQEGETQSFNCVVPMAIFVLNRGSIYYPVGGMRLYWFKIYDNGTLVRDFIPCQTASGDIGLWDDVNSVFYGNAGTGTFTAGPVLTPDAPSEGFVLITDRTKADVINGTEKGSYTASDLNRVGAAMNYVADRLTSQGYAVAISPKTDWQPSDWPTPQTMEQYLDDLNELRRQFTVMESTPKVPADMVCLTVDEANDIEKILEDIDVLLTNIAAGWLYSGEIYSGEV